MKTLINDTVASTLDELELPYEHNGELFTLTVGDDCASFPIRIYADEENEIITTVGFFPVKIPKAILNKMYKFINDLNYKSVLGFYSIDSDDGELSIRMANNVDCGAVNTEIVRSCFIQVLYRLRDTYDAIMKAIYGGEQYTFNFGDENRPFA